MRSDLGPWRQALVGHFWQPSCHAVTLDPRRRKGGTNEWIATLSSRSVFDNVESPTAIGNVNILEQQTCQKPGLVGQIYLSDFGGN